MIIIIYLNQFFKFSVGHVEFYIFRQQSRSLSFNADFYIVLNHIKILHICENFNNEFLLLLLFLRSFVKVLIKI